MPQLGQSWPALPELGPYLSGQIRDALQPEICPPSDNVFSQQEITENWKFLLQQQGADTEKLLIDAAGDLRTLESQLIGLRSLELTAGIVEFRLNRTDVSARDLHVLPTGAVGQRIVQRVSRHLVYVAAEVDPSRQIPKRPRDVTASVGNLALVAKFDGLGIYAVGNPNEGMVLHIAIAPSQQSRPSVIV